MLKAFPRYAIGTAILLSGCQTAPGWMAAWKQPSEAQSVAEKDAPKKNPLTSAFSKKPSEASLAATDNSLKKGKEQLQAFYKDSSRPQHLTDAEKSFERALMVNPRNAEAHHGLGVCLDLQKRYANAEEHYRLAIAEDPRNATYVADLGYSYFLQGRYAEAEKALSGALVLEPNNALAAKNLGMTYARQGKRELAESTFRRVMNDGEVRQAMAQVDSASSDIALASGEQSKTAAAPPAKEGSWDDIQARMEQARQDSVRQRGDRDQQARAAELGLDPARLRQMEAMRQQQQAGQGQDPRGVDPRGGDPRLANGAGVDPRDYRGRDPYADMKNQLQALDRQRTNVANGPVYLDQSGFQAVPHQSATYPEAQHTYHPDGPIQPLAGEHVPSNAATWAPGSYSPHAAPQGNSLVPPASASPYYQQQGQPPAAGGPESGGQGYSVPPQYQSGYAPGAVPQNGQPQQMAGGQTGLNAYGNRPGSAPNQAAYPQYPGQGQGYPQQGQPAAGHPAQGYPQGANGIQQAAAENFPANNSYDTGRGFPSGGNPALMIPSGTGPQGMSPAGVSGYGPAAAAGQSMAPPAGGGMSGSPSLGADFEQAKREAAMHGLGVGPGPLFPSQNASPPQQFSQQQGPGPQGANLPGLPPQAALGNGHAPQPGLQPGDGVQQPSIHWNGSQLPPVDRQLPTNIQVPDLRQAGQPQYESNWDLYRQQGNQYGQQTPAPSATYRSQNQYSAASGHNGAAQAGGAPIGLPATGALTNYDDARGRLAATNQEQQQLLLRSPADAIRSPASEQRNLGPAIPSPSEMMTPTWGNQSIIPPAWPMRTGADQDYRARGYDQADGAASQYERNDNGAAARGVVNPERYPSASSAQRPPTYGGGSSATSQSNANYSNANSGNGLPAIVPGSRNGY